MASCVVADAMCGAGTCVALCLADAAPDSSVRLARRLGSFSRCHRYRGPVSRLGGLPRQLARTEGLRGPRLPNAPSENWAWWGPSPIEVGASAVPANQRAPRPCARLALSRDGFSS